MTGRIVYTPTPPHDCDPPDVPEPAGTKWQCDNCWQVWTLGSIGAGPMEQQAWRRDGNPHCAVVANGEGDLVSVPGPRPSPRLPFPPDDFDAKWAAFWLIGVVLLAVLLAIAGVWFGGGFR